MTCGETPNPWAHPRSRGENTGDSDSYEHEVGSSPLTRGKPPDLNTASIAPGAHPRSRGENVLAAPMIVLIWGSSPLTRGKPHSGLTTFSQRGLIPAHAGKTVFRRVRFEGEGAHPRSRGENTPTTARPPTVTGSSPLTRGKPASGVWSHRRDRLIPAHAGKTLPSCLTRSHWRAHPRSRGENRIGQRRPASGVGSSPLTRGKQCVEEIRGSQGGLIPAHAGKTL